MRRPVFEQALLGVSLLLFTNTNNSPMSPHAHPSISSQQSHLSNVLAPVSPPANIERTESEVRTRNSTAGNKRLTLPAVQIQADDDERKGEPSENTDRRDRDKGKEKDKEDGKWIQGIDYAYEYVPVTQVSGYESPSQSDADSYPSDVKEENICKCLVVVTWVLVP